MINAIQIKYLQELPEKTIAGLCKSLQIDVSAIETGYKGAPLYEMPADVYEILHYMAEQQAAERELVIKLVNNVNEIITNYERVQQISKALLIGYDAATKLKTLKIPDKHKHLLTGHIEGDSPKP